MTPSEENPNIEVCREEWYDYVRPGQPAQGNANTVDPDKAVYDPSFRGSPDDDFNNSDVPEGIGNNSYAHNPLVTVWLENWGTINQISTVAILGNRGPFFGGEVAPQSGARDPDCPWDLTEDDCGVGSNTLLIHGGKSTWEGNVGYNDGHVSFETSMCPKELSVRCDGDQRYRDNLFATEFTCTPANDAYLRIWRRGARTNGGLPDLTATSFIWCD